MPQAVSDFKALFTITGSCSSSMIPAVQFITITEIIFFQTTVSSYMVGSRFCRRKEAVSFIDCLAIPSDIRYAPEVPPTS